MKWVGSDELSWRWRHELVEETCNTELLKEIDDAVTKERERLSTRKDAYAEAEFDEDDATAADDNAQATDDEQLLGRGAPRVRNRPQRLIFHIREEQLTDAVDVAYKIVLRRIVAEAYYMHDYDDWLT